MDPTTARTAPSTAESWPRERAARTVHGAQGRPARIVETRAPERLGSLAPEGRDDLRGVPRRGPQHVASGRGEELGREVDIGEMREGQRPGDLVRLGGPALDLFSAQPANNLVVRPRARAADLGGVVPVLVERAERDRRASVTHRPRRPATTSPWIDRKSTAPLGETRRPSQAAAADARPAASTLGGS